MRNKGEGRCRFVSFLVSRLDASDPDVKNLIRTTQRLKNSSLQYLSNIEHVRQTFSIKKKKSLIDIHWCEHQLRFTLLVNSLN